MSGREELRHTFDAAADTYHDARTRYPSALYDRLREVAGVGRGTTVLELGPATGVATEELAQGGAVITGIELGEQLVAQARRNLAAFADVQIIHGSFDSWEPPAWGSFDVVVAASCWHWMDPETRYERAHRHLRPGGYLAHWSAGHVIPVDGDPFFAEIQEIYDEIGEGMPGGWQERRPGELPERGDEIEASGLFEVASIDQYDWEETYDAEGYISVLQTFSGHIAMTSAQRDRLFGEIRRRLAERPDGTLRRHYGSVLHIARRVD